MHVFTYYLLNTSTLIFFFSLFFFYKSVLVLAWFSSRFISYSTLSFTSKMFSSLSLCVSSSHFNFTVFNLSFCAICSWSLIICPASCSAGSLSELSLLFELLFFRPSHHPAQLYTCSLWWAEHHFVSVCGVATTTSWAKLFIATDQHESHPIPTVWTHFVFV